MYISFFLSFYVFLYTHTHFVLHMGIDNIMYVELSNPTLSGSIFALNKPKCWKPKPPSETGPTTRTPKLQILRSV